MSKNFRIQCVGVAMYCAGSAWSIPGIEEIMDSSAMMRESNEFFLDNYASQSNVSCNIVNYSEGGCQSRASSPQEPASPRLLRQNTWSECDDSHRKRYRTTQPTRSQMVAIYNPMSMSNSLFAAKAQYDRTSRSSVRRSISVAQYSNYAYQYDAPRGSNRKNNTQYNVREKEDLCKRMPLDQELDASSEVNVYSDARDNVKENASSYSAGSYPDPMLRMMQYYKQPFVSFKPLNV